MTPAYRAWVGYYLDTEHFDRSLPGQWSSRSPNSWLPYCRSRSERFARARLAALDREHARDTTAMKAACCDVEMYFTPEADPTSVYLWLCGSPADDEGLEIEWARLRGEA